MRISQMFDDRDDNTWVFAGGRAVQGSFSDIAGARNYIGEFEEYVRFTLVQKSGDVRQQRHTISTAYHGQDIAEALAGFAARIAPLDPRAVVYMAAEKTGCGEPRGWKISRSACGPFWKNAWR